jgi:hypothetical protein
MTVSFAMGMNSVISRTTALPPVIPARTGWSATNLTVHVTRNRPVGMVLWTPVKIVMTGMLKMVIAAVHSVSMK